MHYRNKAKRLLKRFIKLEWMHKAFKHSSLDMVVQTVDVR